MATLTLRPADSRGSTDIGWLQSRHSFSFGRYQDANNDRYHALRVINDDHIAPGAGFGEHGHDNMEIMTWVLSGALKHGDSLGHMQTLGIGELQVMSAGRDIRHSEMNASQVEPVHLLQMWITPSQRDVEPRYLQRAFDAADRADRWDTLASGDSSDGAMPIDQDAALRVADVSAGASLEVAIEPTRYGYLHLATGRGRAGDIAMSAGDAVTFAGPAAFGFTAEQDTQLLWFDLP